MDPSNLEAVCNTWIVKELLQSCSLFHGTESRVLARGEDMTETADTKVVARSNGIRRTRPREAVEEKAYSGNFASVAGLIEGKASLTDVKSLAQRQAHPALPASRSLFPVQFL